MYLKILLIKLYIFKTFYKNFTGDEKLIQTYAFREQ